MTLTIPQAAAVAMNSFDAGAVDRREAQAIMTGAVEDLLLRMISQAPKLTVDNLETLNREYGLAFEFGNGKLERVYFEGGDQ